MSVVILKWVIYEETRVSAVSHQVAIGDHHIEVWDLRLGAELLRDVDGVPLRVEARWVVVDVRDGDADGRDDDPVGRRAGHTARSYQLRGLQRDSTHNSRLSLHDDSRRLTTTHDDSRRLTAHSSRLTAHGSRLKTHDSRLTGRDSCLVTHDS